jgi:membrane protease YdiL (CAAX protease family)
MNQEKAFWSYEDLMLFLGAAFPVYVISAWAMKSIHFPSRGVQQVAFQSTLYAFMLGVLYGLLARYGRPFWRSLRWTFSFRWVSLYIIGGPVLAVALAMLAAALHASAETVVENLVTDHLSRILVMVMVCFLAPIFEEMVFRGFLLGLFQKSMADGVAVILTAIPFALLHAGTVRWSWQSMLVIGLAGVAFGYARVRTGSTTAAAILHIGYNSTLFAFFLIQQSNRI